MRQLTHRTTLNHAQPGDLADSEKGTAVIRMPTKGANRRMGMSAYG